MALLALLAAPVAGASYGWQKWGDAIVRGPDYQLAAEGISITPLPPWVRSDVKSQVIADSGLLNRSILDRDLTLHIARAFEGHPWVERVTRVSKHHPAQVVVELIFRRPMAMVEVVLADQPGLLPVDAQGFLLPPGDFSAEQARDYLRIAQPTAGPAGGVGTAWGDDSVHEAARIAEVLQSRWKPMGLYRIQLLDDPQAAGAVRRSYEIVTRQGGRVLWGDPPSPENPASLQRTSARLSQLAAYVDRHGPLDAIEPPVRLDLRLVAADGKLSRGPLSGAESFAAFADEPSP